MSSVKITYIICASLGNFLCIAMAMLANIYSIPHQYWWIGFLLFISASGSYGASVRMNSWRDFGNV